LRVGFIDNGIVTPYNHYKGISVEFMPEEWVPVTRIKEIHPKGADADAAAFRAVAARCRGLREDLSSHQNSLDQVWQGRSRERFFHDHGFKATPINMENLAEWLETQAKRIDQKTVTIEYTVLVPITPTWK
jgi:uncharacterized protein YukE